MSILNLKLKNILVQAFKKGREAAPFFFIKQKNSSNDLNLFKATLKVNCQMSPYTQSKMPENIRLGFWSTPQFESRLIQPQTLENSIILNPYKTESLIRAALFKGIRKMLVSDIQELQKIQKSYFTIRKQGNKLKQPQYIWTVQESQEDLNIVQNLINCQLPIHGIYFKQEFKTTQINNFLKNLKTAGNALSNYRQTSQKNYYNQKQLLQKLFVQPVITNYSQVNEYQMICRVIGKDRNGVPIFEDSCSDFICKHQYCSCLQPPLKISSSFVLNGNQWVVLQPRRLDRIKPQYILN